ncbi:ankyrin repeat and IBR domain-containing protein 1 isoform X2 [Ixodes scapularis]
MGSASSKFRRHLQNGDEYSALQVFETNPELRKTVDPNCFYWDPGNQCTPLHLAARHAMKPLLRVFLEDMQGDPNVRTGKGETALHLASRVPCNVHARTSSAASRRAACLALLVLWRGSEGETVLLDAQDQDGNTALHYAAASGIKKCVELLVSQKASLFVENNQKETACDVASRAHHTSVAEYLEIKMVFSDRVTIEPEEQHLTVDASDKGSTGLRPQDLQEAKDLLLVETSDMFHVPLFTAEALLRTHDWSQVALLEAWVQDPVGCCLGAGVQPTTSALHARDVGPGPDPRLVTQEFQDASLNSPRAQACHLPPKTPCNICSEPMRDDPVAVPCQHHFCFSCWQCYLTLKIQEGSVKGIVCPAVDCPQLVPVDVIEQLVSPEMVRRYLQFDIEAFVETNPDIKWCPWAGCGRAVKLPVIAKPPVLPHRAPPVSHAVDCGNGHYFCWECRGGAHAPCSCDLWKQWRTKVAEVKPEELESAWCHTEDAANSLWMVTNSKPCPSCKSPIQKNEGCNHLKCYKCKHDFCWVCLDPWRKHNSATGGYFRCNRFEAVHRAEERANTIISEAEAKNKEMRELQRFAYYYTHFKEHESSHQTEEALLERAAEKEELWLSELGPGEENQSQARFLCSAVQELLRARRILCGSYAYGFYLYEDGYGRTVFDLMQGVGNEGIDECSPCRECRGGAHAPCSCDLWKQWRTKVAEVKPEELESAWCHTEDAANSLWMVTNSKPCPSCKSPIQKNEGCNHLKCYKCKHDFCWVCLDPWRKHNSATGGYFRCNRFEAVHRAEERANTIISEAEAKNKEMRELQRFAYYYTHFKEHESSHQTEEALLERAAEKEELWLSELGPGEENQSQARFLCSAVQELLRARRILCGSYAYGFYLYEDGYGRTVFDLMQRDLEEASGKLSGMLCGRHLRCPRRVVVEATDRVARKRLELLRAVAQGLVPPESPPRAPRGVRKRPYPTVLGLDPPEDEQVLLALLESVGDAPLDDPWVKDVRGCHANVAALFDWPPENDSNSSADEDAEDLFGDVLGVCARDGCSRPRARNPRTREMHEHCSFKCHRLDRNKDVRPARYEAEFSMDLLIALEMSRLQMIEDQRRFEQNQKNGSQDTNSERQEAGGSGGALSPASPYGGATPSSESGRVGDAGGVRPLGTRNLATGASDNSHKLDKQLFGTQSKGP